MTIEEAIDRLTTIDQLPEVGPDHCKEVEELLDFLLDANDHDGVTFACIVLKDTVNRAVDWNP